MMDLLQSFSTLAMLTGALLTLLGNSSLRKTAALIFGLLLTLCWVEGLLGLTFPEAPDAPDSALQPTGMMLTQIEADALRQLSPEVTPTP